MRVPSVEAYLELLKAFRKSPDLLAKLPQRIRPEIERHLAMPLAEVEAETTSEFLRFPSLWEEIRFNQAAQPVVGVCFFEARAYTLWLSSQCREVVRLPTQAEWGAAVSGEAVRRRWPLGDAEPSLDHVNHDQTHLWRTSPVGVFPRGDTQAHATGLTDMVGNVWEWTSSVHTDRSYPDSFISGCQDDSARRVTRGGAFNCAAWECSASCWFDRTPGDRNLDLGLRLVRAVPRSGHGSLGYCATDTTEWHDTIPDDLTPDHRASDATRSR